MGTEELLVFIPLPPFLCQIRFGVWGSDSGWPQRLRRTAVAADAPRTRTTPWRSIRTHVLGGQREVGWQANAPAAHDPLAVSATETRAFAPEATRDFP